ncbi:MAG TPA: hypothetical protein VJO52_08445 [Gemmatimonadaceae bacterium]|nr:hypothetical protein [Gemmatimonadaceae bacterium]
MSLLAMQACTHNAPVQRVEQAPTFVTVQNVTPVAYQLYLEQSNRRLQAGNVDALATTRIQVPAEMSYPNAKVLLIARPTLSGREWREQFTANPGADIRIQIGR